MRSFKKSRVSFEGFFRWCGSLNGGRAEILSRALLPLAFAAAAIGTVSPKIALAQDYFIGKITVQLCPQYQQGDTEIELDYGVGRGPRAYLPIISKTVQEGSQIGVFTFALPNYMGTTQFNVRAFCVQRGKYSRPSNAAALSNCDALAHRDDDADGLSNNLEDTDCSNFFSPGDRSNPNNVDTDGDGARDLVEVTAGTDPANPGSSPRPLIFLSGPFDPDGDGNSNPVVWRQSNGMWFVRDMFVPDNNIAFQFGLPGDTPFTYTPAGMTSNVGVVRNTGGSLTWFFRGPGVQADNGAWANVIPFGLFGDNILPGQWEAENMTSPAVARLFNGYWTFFILRRDGSTRIQVWGGNGDIPKPQDYDGDGLFDIAVFRPSDGDTYVIRSSDGLAGIYHYGSGTMDHSVRGDFTGDGTDDITFWEPLSGLFYTLSSDAGFNAELGRQGIAPYAFIQQLGLYYVHVPLSFNRHSGQDWFTVVDHATGMRYFRPNNNTSFDPQAIQWGVRGDAQG